MTDIASCRRSAVRKEVRYAWVADSRCPAPRRIAAAVSPLGAVGTDAIIVGVLRTRWSSVQLHRLPTKGDRGGNGRGAGDALAPSSNASLCYPGCLSGQPGVVNGNRNLTSWRRRDGVRHPMALRAQVLPVSKPTVLRLRRDHGGLGMPAQDRTSGQWPGSDAAG